MMVTREEAIERMAKAIHDARDWTGEMPQDKYCDYLAHAALDALLDYLWGQRQYMTKRNQGSVMELVALLRGAE